MGGTATGCERLLLYLSLLVLSLVLQTWIDACKQSGDRAEMLTAIKSLRDADTRQAALKRHNFWRVSSQQVMGA